MQVQGAGYESVYAVTAGGDVLRRFITAGIVVHGVIRCGWAPRYSRRRQAKKVYADPKTTAAHPSGLKNRKRRMVDGKRRKERMADEILPMPAQPASSASLLHRSGEDGIA